MRTYGTRELSPEVTLSIIKEDGEYCVRWIENGMRMESKSYYTDDLEDAQDTMEIMR